MKCFRCEMLSKDLSYDLYLRQIFFITFDFALFRDYSTKNDNIKRSGPYVNDVPKHAECLLNRSLAFSYIFEWHTKSIFRVNA